MKIVKREQKTSTDPSPICKSSNELLAELKKKSIETWEHSLRVECYCRAVGQKLRLSDHEMIRLSLLALFHDIGKLEISRDLLQKKGKLTADEWEKIKRHPQTGCNMVADIPEIRDISMYILYHHEHWNGSGYPKGLRSGEIPFLSRILAVCDAFDAMTTDRSYRKAMEWSDAIIELENNSGKQFDPDIVRLFIESRIKPLSLSQPNEFSKPQQPKISYSSI